MTAAGSRRRKTYDDLRSKRWYGVADLRAFGHRSRTLQMGYAREDWVGKPVIAAWRMAAARVASDSMS